ncbi:hypothetical protein ACFLY0_00020 [Patescibacteria group bacterium]
MNKNLTISIIIFIILVGGSFLWYQSNTLKTVPSDVEIGLLMPELGLATKLPTAEYAFTLGDGLGTVSKNGIEEFGVYPLPLIDVKSEYNLSKIGSYKAKTSGFAVYTQDKDGETIYYIDAPKMDFAIFPTNSPTSIQSIETFIDGLFYPEQLAQESATRKSDVGKGKIIPATEADHQIVTVEDENHNPVQVDISDWPYYRHEQLGFQVRFPKGYEVKENFEFADNDPDEMLMGLGFKKSGDKQSQGYMFAFSQKYSNSILELQKEINDKATSGLHELYTVPTTFGDLILVRFKSFRILNTWFTDDILFVQVATFDYSLSELSAILSTFKFLR